MLPPRPTEILHLLLKNALQPGELVIDATAGNGHDTKFLAETVGQKGKVIAFDIQQQAIAETARRLAEADFLDRVELHQKSHTLLAQYAAPRSVAAIVFNLGYLPGADHSIFTQVDETLDAIDTALELITPTGILAVTCYPGHHGGDAEACAVEENLANNSSVRTAKYKILNTQKPSPFLLITSPIFKKIS